MASTRGRRPSTSEFQSPAREEWRDARPLLSPLGRARRALGAFAGAALALGAVACGEAAPGAATTTDGAAESIIGGTLAENGEFPAVVSLGGCSGTLVHPSLVVYAEHCGTAISQVRFGAQVDAPERVVATDRCRGFPGAKLGNGTDLAYCVLEEPVLDIEPERIASGCELSDVEAGAPVTLVGYGIEGDGGAYGVKRSARSRIDSVGEELILERGMGDTCRGDSGGPVFIERQERDGSVQRRLVGVTSAGTEAECGSGVGHYVHLGNKLAWLEDSAQLDLSPCFAQGDWSPTAACVVTGREPGAEDESSSQPAYLRSCGEPFDLPVDETPPSVAWTQPGPDGFRQRLSPEATYAELELAVDATDSEWGVARVSFVLRDADERTLFRRDDEIAPYALPLFRVPPGRFVLSAEAVDFAGNRSDASVALLVNEKEATAFYLRGGGCASSPRGSGGAAWLSLLVLSAFSLLRVRRL